MGKILGGINGATENDCWNIGRGGPAPGIIHVISAVTIRSILGCCDVVGFLDGFTWLVEGSTNQGCPLSIKE